MEINSTLRGMTLKTNAVLENVEINKTNITKIIEKLNSNKAHGYDNISIAMFKICSFEVALPLQIIYQRCLNEGTFPASWKKANVQPIHIKRK